MPIKKEEKIKKPIKRKKVKVRVFKPEKVKNDPVDLPFNIDLSSGIDPSPAPVLPVAEKEVTKEKEIKEPSVEKTGLLAEKFEDKEKKIKEEIGEETEEIATEEEEKIESGVKLPINLYRKIAFSFIFFTSVLLAVLLYFSFIKVTIAVTPKEEVANNNLIFDVYDKNNGGDNTEQRGLIAGAVEKQEIEETKIYNSTGGEVTGEEVIGMVTIINNYNKSQPLVATTRILSQDGKLFRIKNTVNAPAGSSVEVEVYADKPSADMAISSSKFTIPGLWEGLQDKIYAENKEPFIYRKNEKKIIARSDIEAGVEDLKKAALVKAEEGVAAKYDGYGKRFFKLDENSININIDGEIGEEKEQFSISIKAEVFIVAFSEEPVIKMAEDKLNSALASDKELISFSKETMIYNLDGINENERRASVNVSFEGNIFSKDGSLIIDKSKILGLSRNQLDDYLANTPSLLNYEVKFFPSFIKKVPTSADRVEIKIQK